MASEIYDQFADAWDEMYPDQKLPEEPNARGDASHNLLEPFESEGEGLLAYWRLPPSFVQEDPRDEFEELRDHTVNPAEAAHRKRRLHKLPDKVTVGA